jgi:hypothetical protein
MLVFVFRARACTALATVGIQVNRDVQFDAWTKELALLTL